MTDQEIERSERIQEAKIYHLAAPVMLPILGNKKRIAMERLMGKYREGSGDFLNLIAEISVLSDLEREIMTKADMFTTLRGRE